MWDIAIAWDVARYNLTDFESNNNQQESWHEFWTTVMNTIYIRYPRRESRSARHSKQRSAANVVKWDPNSIHVRCCFNTFSVAIFNDQWRRTDSYSHIPFMIADLFEYEFNKQSYSHCSSNPIEYYWREITPTFAGTVDEVRGSINCFYSSLPVALEEWYLRVRWL